VDEEPGGRAMDAAVEELRRIAAVREVFLVRIN
jgi:hypothetical protein